MLPLDYTFERQIELERRDAWKEGFKEGFIKSFVKTYSGEIKRRAREEGREEVLTKLVQEGLLTEEQAEQQRKTFESNSNYTDCSDEI